MGRFHRCFVTALLILSPIIDQSDATDTSLKSEANRCIQIVDTVFQRHIDPPPREAMTLALIQEVDRQTGNRRTGLARQITGASLESQAKQLLDAAQSGNQLKPGQLTTVCDQVLARILADGLYQRLESKESKVQSQIAANRYVGIGIAISKPPEGPAVMARVFPNGPSYKIGAKDGTKILTVDGTDTQDINLREVVDRLRGPRGSKVKLKLQGPGNTAARDVTIVRDVVPFKMLSGWKLYGKGKNIGYLRVERIAGSTPQELIEYDRRIRESKIQGLVLDLTQCQAGTIHHAVLFADQLMSGGVIGSVFDGKSTRQYKAQQDCLFAEIPIAIVVSAKTTGTAAWFAESLRASGRAYVFGTSNVSHPYASEWIEMDGETYSVQLATRLLLDANGKRMVTPKPTATNLADMPGVSSAILRALPQRRQQLQGPQRIVRRQRQAPRISPGIYNPMSMIGNQIPQAIKKLESAIQAETEQTNSTPKEAEK